MKKIIYALLLFISFSAFAGGDRDLIRQQEKQEKIIRAAYKRHKVTEQEYRKLMAEQKTIKRYMDLADADHVWSPAEKNRIKGKLDRAEHRLVRYKNNSEVY
ncbi:MAG: hypothetical protein JNJ58_04350 [Chitinophagaceae bacterium]|nr:hypothetical protein [Chitinophagaceae bacterium]